MREPEPAGDDGRDRGHRRATPLTPLTAAQREAVEARDPLLCVLAAAGAGKTRVLTLRVARRIGDGSAEPDHILVCTFSRKAADELRHRLWATGAGEGVHAGTIHRTALALLRQHRSDRGLPPPVLVADRRSLIAEVMASGDGARGRRRPAVEAAGRIDTEIGWAKARMVRPDGYERAAAAHGRRTATPASTVAAHYRLYEEARRHRGLIDLDDLLTVCADTLAGDAAFAEAVRWRYRHLFVDEMQDVNPAQFRLLSALLGDEPDLFVVGDPHQSVYGWNGADPALLDRLPEIFTGTRVIRLDENHRSSPQVVATAAAALGLSGASTPTSARQDGPVPRLTAHETDHDEARWVARQIWRAHRPGSSWANTAVLARTNAQLLAVAEALSAERVPHRQAGGDLGPASDLSGEDRRTRSWQAGSEDREGDDDADGGGSSIGGEQGTGGYRDANGAPSDAVTLSTFHRAKGLQWRAVFVVGLSEGLVPLASSRTDGAMAEERRLLYVALTRAEEELSCSWARCREQGAAVRRPSRWLDAIGPVLEQLAEATGPPDPAVAASQLAALRARLAAQPGDRR